MAKKARQNKLPPYQAAQRGILATTRASVWYEILISYSAFRPDGPSGSCRTCPGNPHSPLPQRYIQIQHHHDADHGADGGEALVAFAMCLRHDLIADNIEHRPGSESHGVGENGDGDLHRTRPE